MRIVSALTSLRDTFDASLICLLLMRTGCALLRYSRGNEMSWFSDGLSKDTVLKRHESSPQVKVRVFVELPKLVGVSTARIKHYECYINIR